MLSDREVCIKREVFLMKMNKHGAEMQADIERAPHHKAVETDRVPAAAHSIGQKDDAALPKGIAALGGFIAQDDDVTIFRAFRILGVRNLMYLQSKLSDLDAKLRALDREEWNAPGNPELRTLSRAYYNLGTEAESYAEQERREGVELENKKRVLKRVGLHEQIQILLREYREAQIQEQEAMKFKRPTRLGVSLIKDKYRCNIIRDDHEILSHTHDLITLKSSEDDRLDRILRYTCGYWLRDKKHESIADSDIYISSNSKIQFTGHILSVLFRGILLLGAMACLSLIPTHFWKLRLVSLFAVVVGLLTNARRAEVFGSTAAYAAVSVVFVSGNLGSQV